MSAGINRYKADLREMFFLAVRAVRLRRAARQGAVRGLGHGRGRRPSSTETYRFAREVLGPAQRDRRPRGLPARERQVITPTGFKEAWKKLYEAGCKTLGVDPEHGGQGAPLTLQVLVEEMLSGANTAFNMYPGARLRRGRGDRRVRHARAAEARTCEQHVQRQVGRHHVPHRAARRLRRRRGADHGAASNADGTLQHPRHQDLHLRRRPRPGREHRPPGARALDGAPPGTKGLSLFIVPKLRIDADGTLGQRNDVTVGAIEHKMGINGSATCVLNFGENDSCIGELVGTVENAGHDARCSR